MESEIIDDLKAQIKELKAELHIERKLRKKIESLNKKLVKELAEEREEMERECEEIMRQLEWKRLDEIEKMKKEIDEERKMLKVAEIFREERVQMKLADAKIMYEEKLLHQLQEFGNGTGASAGLAEKKMSQRSGEENISNRRSTNDDDNSHDVCIVPSSDSATIASIHSRGGGGGGCLTADVQRSVGGVISSGERLNCAPTPTICGQRKVGANSPEPENPHIKRGIKGYVEFPKVIKAINGSSNTNSSNNAVANSYYKSSGKNSMTMMGTKFQYCQKAQLRVLLKQRSPLRSSSSSNLIIS